MIETNKIYQGDALEVLKTFPDESINCVMTSPPYWALRDYGIDGQLGLEKTFEEYINKLCNVFDEVKRVLKKDGTCWVVIGDTYSAGGGKAVEQSAKRQSAIDTGAYPDYSPNSKLRSKMGKSLVMIPFRFAIEMVNRGWILRNTIIWHKPNCMPSSVKDRFTVDFEYIFFFVKSKKYYFEQQFEEHLTEEGKLRNKNREGKSKGYPFGNRFSDGKRTFYGEQGRNKRAVWQVTTKPFKESHFAVFPPDLIETPIKAGCPENGIVLDPFMGSGTTGLSALKQNKRFIGIELNPEYIKIAEARIKPYLKQIQLNSEEAVLETII